MGGKCLGHGRATLFIREEEVAAWGPILQKVLKLHHLAQFWQSGAPALFGGFHQMAMQAGKIQLVHYSAAREYGLKPGHAQLTRFFRDQIDAALFDGCDAQPEIWNGFQRLCLADDVESKRSEEHTSELTSLMRTSYAVFRL